MTHYKVRNANIRLALTLLITITLGFISIYFFMQGKENSDPQVVLDAYINGIFFEASTIVVAFITLACWIYRKNAIKLVNEFEEIFEISPVTEKKLTTQWVIHNEGKIKNTLHEIARQISIEREEYLKRYNNYIYSDFDSKVHKTLVSEGADVTELEKKYEWSYFIATKLGFKSLMMPDTNHTNWS